MDSGTTTISAPRFATSLQARNNAILARNRKRRRSRAAGNELPEEYVLNEDGTVALNEDGTVEVPEES